MVQRYKEIVLHAGPGKTGSTSIQKNCHLHRELLAAHGIVYPGFDLNGRHLINHSDAITTAICDPPTKYGAGWRQNTEDDPQAAREQLRAQWVPLLREPRGETLVLSGENVAEYSDRDMQALKGELIPHCDRLRVMAFIRSPQSSLESILQQRVKGGAAIRPESIIGVVRKRYESLQRNFPAELEAYNFHEAVNHPRGLVGFFMLQCGLAPEELPAGDFSSSNERISLEAFGIMLAINERYPRRQMAVHGVKRRFRDLNPLKELPGQGFQLGGVTNARVQRALRREARWLEKRLGFEFPPLPARKRPDLWQDETLEALEDTVNRLREPELRAVAAEHLQQEARRLRWRDLETAAALAYIAGMLPQSYTDQGLRRRRKEKREHPQSLDDLKAYALPWYKHGLVQENPILKLPLALKRALRL